MALETRDLDYVELREASPTELAQVIRDASELIDQSKGRIEEIRGRSFLRKLFRNNTRDLANAMCDQNEAMRLFMKILQTVAWINMNNTVVLGQLWENLNELADQGRGFQNEYMEMATSYVAATYASAVTFNKQFADMEQRLTDQENVSQSHATKLSQIEQQVAQIGQCTLALQRRLDLEHSRVDRIKRVCIVSAFISICLGAIIVAALAMS